MTAAVRNWVTLVLWSVVAGITLFWGGRFVYPLPQHALVKYNTTIVPTCVVFGLIASFIYRMRFGFGFIRFPQSIGWRVHTVPPPLWFAAPISLAIMALWALIFSRPLPWSASAVAYLFVGWLVGVAMQRLLRYIKCRKTPQDAIRRVKPAADNACPSIIDWIRSPEQPIISPEQDIFGVDKSAMRVANRLKTLDDHRVPTLSLLDAPGAGKTSFLNLVNYYLSIDRAGPQIHLREVSVWAAQTREAMLELIINLMCEELRDEVDTFWFRGMSHEFVRSLRAKESLTQSLFGWLISPPRASQMLNAISAVLVALNRRLVLVIEDLERKKADLPQFAESLAGVLDLIRGTQGISYIITNEPLAADDDIHPTIDFARLCRISDSLPMLSPDRCAEIIEQYRKFVGEEARGRQIIDPVPIAARQQRWLDTRTILCGLSLTPRFLKKSLANVDNRIKSLLGEIDVDGAITAAIYREVAPGRWNNYLRSHARYRDGDPLHIQPVTMSAGHTILIPDVPLMSLPPTGSDSDNPANAWPQNIFAGGWANYWTRFTTGECDVVLDQTILKAIQDGDVDSAIGLGKPNISGRCRERVCHFSYYAVRHNFLKKLLERISQSDVESHLRASQFPTIPTVVAWLQIATLRSPSHTHASSTVMSTYQRAFEFNLEVAMALIRPFDYLNAEFFGIPFATASSDQWAMILNGLYFTRELLLRSLAEQLQRWNKEGESPIVRLFKNASPAALTAFSRLYSVPYAAYDKTMDKDEAISKRRLAWLQNARNPVDLPHAGKLLGEAISAACDSNPELLYPQLLYGWCNLSDTATASNSPDTNGLINGQLGLNATPENGDLCIPGLPIYRTLELFSKIDPADILPGSGCEQLLKRANDLRAWADARARMRLRALQSRVNNTATPDPAVLTARKPSGNLTGSVSNSGNHATGNRSEGSL